MIETQWRLSRFLEWLYDQGGEADIADFHREVAGDDDVPGWREVIRGAARDGYANVSESLSTTNGGARLLTPGRVRVEELRARRVDRRLRHAAMEAAILNWLRSGPEELALVSDLPAALSFEGSPYEAWERERAWESLRERRLITGTDSANGLFLAQLTASGRDCVDYFGGFVSDYQRDLRAVSNIVNIQGDNSGNIASGNRDVIQMATTHNALDIADIAEIMHAVIEIADGLGLSDPERAELVRTAESAQYELSVPDPDVNAVKALGGKVIRFLGRTAGSVVPVVLTKYLELKLGIIKTAA
jgi:hypothetical protein